MESEEMYHSTACREMKIVHTTGVLSYNSQLPSLPVAQFIGPKPFSDKFTKFSFVILNRGEKGTISIGLCPNTYSSNNQPGSEKHSIGYHGNDGGIFLESGFICKAKGSPCDAGDIMECEYLVEEKKVIFYKNGEQVYQTKLKFESSSCFPIVGMHSKGESVKLLEKEPWIPLRLLEAQNSLTDIRYTMSVCNEMTINQETGVLSYETTCPGIHVPSGQFIGPRPFSKTFTKFSIVILNRGAKGVITIGICPSTYPVKRQPGWDNLSIGYHADNGGIYSEYASDCVTKGSPCSVGDAMECELIVKDKMLTFYRNKIVVYRTKVKFPLATCFPIIGMQSKGETVKLLEQEPWRPLRSDPIPRNTEGFQYSPSRCESLQISHQTGILCYAPSAKGFENDDGQFIGPKSFSKDFTKFSFEIMNAGEIGGIAIGVCFEDYKMGSLPGWHENSIGYYAADGGIYQGDVHPKTIKKACKAGDVMQCKLMDDRLVFKRNGTKVYNAYGDFPSEFLYPVIGLSSLGECVRLLETDPWISDSDEQQSQMINEFDSITKDNILISPKDELTLTLAAKGEYTGWIIIQNTGLRNILYKVLNEKMSEPAASIASVLKPGTSKAIHILFEADLVPESLSMRWYTVECMDMNSYPSTIDGVLRKNANDTEQYHWRVSTKDENPLTLSEVSDECRPEICSKSPPQDELDSYKMSTESSVMAQVATLTEQWNECNMCESKDNIVSKCIECGDILCEICESMHKKHSKTKFHTLLPFSERKKETEYKKLLFCAEHDFEFFIRYCTKCDALVCTDCMQGDHVGHPLSKIEKIARGKRQQLTTVSQKMSEYCTSMSESGLREFEELVKQRANHFVDLMKAKEKEILSVLKKKNTNMQPLLEECNSSVQEAEAVLKSYSDVRLIADETLGDLITKLGDFETPKKVTREDVDEMFLKDFP